MSILKLRNADCESIIRRFRGFLIRMLALATEAQDLNGVCQSCCVLCFSITRFPTETSAGKDKRQ